MSRPDTPQVSSLRKFRERLTEARRQLADSTDLDGAVPRFIAVQNAIDLCDRAIEDEQDLAPLPRVDDPTVPNPLAGDPGISTPVISRE